MMIAVKKWRGDVYAVYIVNYLYADIAIITSTGVSLHIAERLV